jgi:adenine-specific DNA-methyltransferase
MDKLKMTSKGAVPSNVEKIAALFPNCVTEVATRVEKTDGTVRYVSHPVVDFDKLRQELSTELVEGAAERYQFTWPDKRAANHLANQPTTMTLRPCEEESVGKDGTNGVFDSENLYIEGDNLDVLKVLRETYLGKVKMIYIDPPYNTGNDFVYNDDFDASKATEENRNGLFDDEGNQTLSQFERNTAANGRFHTDWLNMIYPRLKIARDLLSNDGVIFISIDDNEVENLKKICNEIFGEHNFVSIINWKGRGGRQDSKYYAVIHEYIVCYAKNIDSFQAGEEIKEGEVFPKYDEKVKRNYKVQLLRKWGSNSLRENRPNLYYPITAPDGIEVYPTIYNESKDCALGFVRIQGRWRHGASTLGKIISDGRVEFQKNKWGEWVPYEKIYEPLPGEENTKKYTTWIDDVSNGTDTLKSIFGKAIFDYSKSPELILKFLKMANVDETDTILDFFSGSATTAHSVMKLNAEDGGNRRFIMVQLPEVTDEKSEARKAGYNTICEIGKERIRRAGRKIKEESGLQGQDIDIGFRVLKLAESNMEDVYYSPDKFDANNLFTLADNVKQDRTAEDLLFQVMLELGVELSSPIEKKSINGVEVFNVKDGFLIATFDKNVNESTITEIAKSEPVYFVMRDASAANDNVLDNFDQLFRHYSPDTIRRIL